MEQRRSLLHGDVTPTPERRNVFDDEFEVDDFEWDGVVDGFRPNVDSDAARDFSARQDDLTDEPVQTASARYSITPVTPTISREVTRTSTRKSRTYPNPFASPEDDDETARNAERPHSLEFEPDGMARRSTSSASSTVYAPTQSPRFGAGPSHPYGMYRQGTVARSASVATNSTVRHTGRQSYPQSRPQHPYAMYPQGVDDDDLDDDDDMPIHQNPVPVGFPGVAQGYTRRLGPDGEDQDIIGEDGHREQLPPYTRYPEDGPEKVPLLPPVPLHSRAPVLGTDPSMPLMHTTIQPSPTPAPQSMTDESTLHRSASRNSESGLLSSSSSSSSGNTSTKAADKAWKDKSWKEKRKTRFCGIPFWWILLSVCVLTFVAAVLGGVIGGFVAGGKHARNKPTVTVVTSLYDASLIASPTSGAPPTGTWALSLGLPEETQRDCLPQASQQVAWDCDLSPNSALGLVVASGSPGKGMGANVFYASYDNTIEYGAQLSYMNTSFANFMTVQDKDDPQGGPAFYFQQYYDKVVVIPEEAISVDSDNNKLKPRGSVQSDFVLSGDWIYRRQVAHPGEKPWFCVWNSTFLEGFIYVQQPVSSSTTSSSMNSTVSPTSPPTQSSGLPTPPPTTGTAAPTSTTPPPEVITTTITAPSLTTATYTGPQSGFPAWSSDTMEDAKRRAYALYKADREKHGKRDISLDSYWSTLEVFPYIVKLEERRVDTNDVAPYCQQYQILDDGNANWVGDGDGKPIIIELDEQIPTYETNSNMKRKRTVPGACHCQWMSGQQL